MPRKTVIQLHGFASSSQGTKASFLAGRFAGVSNSQFHAFDFNPTPRDFEYMTVTGLINRLRQHVIEHYDGPISLIGDSLGGLTALHYADRYGGVERLLLLAPVLGEWVGITQGADLDAIRAAGGQTVEHYAFKRDVFLRAGFYTDILTYTDLPEPPAPILIIHGGADTTVSIEPARRYAAAHPGSVSLLEVDAEHDLYNQLDFIWEQVEGFLLA